MSLKIFPFVGIIMYYQQKTKNRLTKQILSRFQNQAWFGLERQKYSLI